MSDSTKYEMIEPDFDGAAKILKAYKNRYEGQRCFIIGNGPSLRAADLDKIKEHGDFSIASNRIYLIFGETEWRPNVWTATDAEGIRGSLSEMSAIPAELKIIPLESWQKMYPMEGALPVRLDPGHGGNWLLQGTMPPFSDELTRCVYAGKTITYVNIQIAAYLGFSKIILLGMDHSYSVHAYLASHLRGYDWQRNERNYQAGQRIFLEPETKTFEGVQDHFCANYWDGLNIEQGYWIEAAVRAYQAAKKYAEEHDVQILNATRGGKLNVFKRVNFDSLFKEPQGGER